MISITSRARHDPAPVAGQDGLPGLRVGGGQTGVQRPGPRAASSSSSRALTSGSVPGNSRLSTAPPGRRGRSRRRAPASAPRRAARRSASREPLVLGHGRGDRHVPDVEQVVRDATAFLGRQFRGADVHPTVELHGVGVDDLTAEPLGQEDAQIGLSGRGGSDYGDDAGGGGCAASPHQSRKPLARPSNELRDGAGPGSLPVARFPAPPGPPGPWAWPRKRTHRMPRDFARTSNVWS